MNSITLESSTLHPGGTLRGTVSWGIPHPPRKLEVRVFWYNGEPGSGEARTIGSLELGEAQEGSRGFDFALPELPWSVTGQVVKVGWAIELVEKKSGSLALADFTMSPDGGVAMLGKVDEPWSGKGSLFKR